MTDRDRLIELILNAPRKDVVYGDIKLDKPIQTAQTVADHLLANGVIVPPCKVGDTVYKITHLCGGETIIVKGTVIEITMTEKSVNSKKVDYRFYFWADGEVRTQRMHSLWCYWFDVGETVFLTKEEAEEKLKELKDNA